MSIDKEELIANALQTLEAIKASKRRAAEDVSEGISDSTGVYGLPMSRRTKDQDWCNTDAEDKGESRRTANTKTSESTTINERDPGEPAQRRRSVHDLACPPDLRAKSSIDNFVEARNRGDSDHSPECGRYDNQLLSDREGRIPVENIDSQVPGTNDDRCISDEKVGHNLVHGAIIKESSTTDPGENDITTAEIEDELEEDIRNGTPKIPKRLKAFPIINSSPTPPPRPHEMIKRGIGGNTSSHGIIQDSESLSGVTPSVQGSEHSPNKRTAHAVDAQFHAACVNMKINTDLPDRLEMTTTVENSHPNVNTSDQSCSTITSTKSTQTDDNMYPRYQLDSQIAAFMEKKFDALTQLLIPFSNLQSTILKLSQDVEAQGKILARHGLLLSTLEGYMSSVMIAIPGSGQKDNHAKLNPDLRPVIGRDKGRGFKEVSIGMEDPEEYEPKVSSPDKIRVQSKQGIFPEPLDMSKTNASQFVPEGNQITKEILLTLVTTRIPDPTLSSKLKRIILNAKPGKSYKMIHAKLVELITKYQIANETSSEEPALQ